MCVTGGGRGRRQGGMWTSLRGDFDEKEYEGRKVDVLGKGELNCVCPFIFIYIFFFILYGTVFRQPAIASHRTHTSGFCSKLRRHTPTVCLREADEVICASTAWTLGARWSRELSGLTGSDRTSWQQQSLAGFIYLPWACVFACIDKNVA